MLDDTFAPESEFLRTLIGRGFLHQCTDLAALDQKLIAGPVCGYNGFDLTADSLHVGHLIPIMMLRWMQKTGHQPIVLMGGGTTRIGDPSFRDTSRPLLDTAQIQSNLESIQRAFSKFLTFSNDTSGARLMNNADWLENLGYIDFLRDFARHFSVNRMLGMESVRSRLDREQSLSLLEFNYMVLQAYDFLELSRTVGCTLQLGASDQWGNIVSGVELGRRVDGTELFGLTAPLLTTASGAKMGKTAAGAVWLNADRLAPYEFWQFWRNTEDADVGRFLKLFTELPLVEISRLESLGGSEINVAKKVLADAITAMVHGNDAASAARTTAEDTFEIGELGNALPRVGLRLWQLQDGVPVIDLMITASLVVSRGEARRLIRGGGVRVNDHVVSDELMRVCEDHVCERRVKLSVGKKRHVVVELEAD